MQKEDDSGTRMTTFERGAQGWKGRSAAVEGVNGGVEWVQQRGPRSSSEEAEGNGWG